jgi:hypothetical protein
LNELRERRRNMEEIKVGEPSTKCPGVTFLSCLLSPALV